MKKEKVENVPSEQVETPVEIKATNQKSKGIKLWVALVILGLLGLCATFVIGGVLIYTNFVKGSKCFYNCSPQEKDGNDESTLQPDSSEDTDIDSPDNAEGLGIYLFYQDGKYKIYKVQDPNIGGAVYSCSDSGECDLEKYPVSVEDIPSPQKIKLQNDGYMLGALIYETDLKTMYFTSFVVDNKIIAEVYSLKIPSTTAELIYSFDYAKEDIPVMLDAAPGYLSPRGIYGNSYLLLELPGCASDECVPSFYYIINLTTRAKIDLGAVGNIEIDPNKKRVSYQKIVEGQDCETYDWCIPSYAPQGPVLIKALP